MNKFLLVYAVGSRHLILVWGNIPSLPAGPEVTSLLVRPLIQKRMQVLSSAGLPEPNGHYSHCIEHNGLLYLSGQLPIHPKTREIPRSVEAQTRLVLGNVERILQAAGVTKEDVIQARVYITDISLWDEVNKEYRLFFGVHKPVRSIIPVSELHYGCLLELEILAKAR